MGFANRKTYEEIQIPTGDPNKERLMSRNWNYNLDDGW